MRDQVRRSLLMLAVSTLPGVAAAQMPIGMADRAPDTALRDPAYRLTLIVTRRDTSRPTTAALLERLFIPRGGFGTPSRRHAEVYRIGGVEISAEAMRGRPLPATNGAGWRAVRSDRFAAVGIKTGVALGGTDDLALGIAASMSKRAEPTLLAGHKSIDGEALAADCTWTHGAHLQMSLGWRSDRGSSGGGVNRMVELAQGATLREQGVRLALSYRLAGAEDPRSTTVGIAARDARVGSDDLAAIGSSNRRDMRTALFLRTAF